MGIGAREHTVIRELTQFIRGLCGDRSSIEESVIEHWDLPVVWVTPAARGARPISIIGEQWVVLTVGRGLRWELDYSDEDVAEAKRIIRAVVEGRGAEFTKWPFSRWVRPY